MNGFRIEPIVVGPLEVNCYLVGCLATRQAAVIDPGADGGRIVGRLRGLGWRPVMMLYTHGHMDHWAAAADVADDFPAPGHMHRDDRYLLTAPDIFGLSPLLKARPCPEPQGWLDDGQQLAVGQLTIQILHTPGHTPGGCCLLLDTVCFTGDTLFAGGIGRTDLPGGDETVLLNSIRKQILTLPPHARLLPGHGPESTVEDEIHFNPYVVL